MAHVLVTRALAGDGLERLREQHDVDVWEHEMPPSAQELRERIGASEGLLCLLTERIDAGLLDAAPRLRVVSNYAVGFDNVDVEACAERGIAVGTTGDVLTDATADLAMALLLAVARRLPEAHDAVLRGRWRTWDPRAFLGLELDGASLAVVGPGRIGRAVVRRAEAFGMRVETVGRGDDLHAALAHVDAVSLHAPLTNATRHLIDAAALAAMRPSAILVNTARGGLVDQAALADALHAGTIGAAALDVTDPEPPAPEDPLLRAPRLLVVPHIGSATQRARERMADLAVDNLLTALDGRPMPHPAAA
jgi:glyoxylate reductase